MEQAPEYIHQGSTDVVKETGATWQAPEYHFTVKTRDWFVGLGLITITVSLISILVGDMLFALFILLAGFALAIFAHRPPRIITIQMGTRGMLVDKTLYLYNEMESFWIEMEENPAHPRILFKSKRVLMPYIVIPLGDMHPDDVGDFLVQFLPEIEHKEPLFQRLLEDIGF